MQNLAVIRWAVSFGFLNCAFPGVEGKLAASLVTPECVPILFRNWKSQQVRLDQNRTIRDHILPDIVLLLYKNEALTEVDGTSGRV